MRKNRSQYSSKKYPNLYRYPDRPGWVFRKYSRERRGEFKLSTGESDESRAYKVGVEAFNHWMGSVLPSGRQHLIRDIGRAVLAAKETAKDGMEGATYRSSYNQIRNHIFPAFGHLRPEQMTPLKWDSYIAEERRAGRGRKFFNMRKALIEILNRAKSEGLISQVPKFRNPDGESKPPKFLDQKTTRALLHAASSSLNPKKLKEDPNYFRVSSVKLLAFICLKQGARPGEVRQYEWNMIHWDEGPHGSIHISGTITKTGRSRDIPLNSRVARVLRWLEPRADSPFIFPHREDPERPMAEYAATWRRVCLKAGFPGVEIYNLRDTFITDKLMSGISSTLIAKYVDSSTAMIDKHYAVSVKQAMERIAG